MGGGESDLNFDEIYASLCRRVGKMERLKRAQNPPEELRENIRFANLNVTGEEVTALCLLAGLSSSAIVAAFTALTVPKFGISLIHPVILPIPALIYISLGWYPSWKSEKKRRSIAGGIPRLVSHLSVALKINPNLERASRFAAEGIQESINEGFRGELWRAVLRDHLDYRRALDSFGNFWRGKCEELKKSIDLIKSSLRERNENIRKKVLDQALETSFEGIQKEMDQFISNLKLPTTIVYGVGILLPLILVSILPVVSSMGVGINAMQLGFIYCLILPLSVYLIERYSLNNRPAALDPPDVGPSKLGWKSAVPFGALSIIPLVHLANLTEETVILSVIWAVGMTVSLYCHLSSHENIKVREKNELLSRELPETITILGNHLKSGRPIEKALKVTGRDARKSELSEILKKAAVNMKMGDMGIRPALFDPNDGALRHVCSTSINSTFKILTDLVSKNTQAAGRALLDKADHLRKIRSTKRKLRNSLQEITGSMKSVAFFFAPLVASVTVQLQRVLSKKSVEIPILGSGTKINNGMFLGIMGFYILALTVLISDYIVEIERGNDGLFKRRVMAKAVPTTLTVFTVGIYLGKRMLSFLL
ncbi:MAG: type II secretion system F family protein [Candidatus Hadarchaeota archaeon]